MKGKHAIVLVLAVLFVGTLCNQIDAPMMPTAGDSSLQTTGVPVDAPQVSDELDSSGNMMINVNPNPSFENWAGDMPADYDNAFASTYRNAIFDYYDPGVTGNFAVLIETEASGTSSAGGLVGTNIAASPPALVEPGIFLSFDWNVLEHPVYAVGGYVYVEVQTWDGASAYRNFFYTLSRSSTGSNGTIDATYYLNDTLNEWHSFNRNITDDYVEVWGAGDLSSSQRVVLVRLRTYSPAGTTGITRVAFDNVVLTDGIYSDWIGNGDFETGDSTSWDYSDGSMGYLEQSTDSTLGTYSMNMSVPLNTVGGGSVQVYRSLDYPGGYFASSPGMMYIDLDWKYNDSSAGGGNQYAYLELRFRNQTSYYYTYYYIGTQDNVLHSTNYTTTHSFEIPGFGAKDVWHHSRFDVYDYVSSAGFYNVSLYQTSFYVANWAPGASVFLLVDDFQITTYPLGDPGFEEDWYNDGATPFAGWDQYNGGLDNIRRTTDAYQGSYACNLSGVYLNTVGVYRDEDVPVNPNDTTRFAWRIDEIGNEDAWAIIRILFTTGDYFNYLLGGGSNQPFGNGSSWCTFYVESFNTTGSWNLLERNMTADYEAAFGPAPALVIEQIVLRMSVGTNDRLVLLFDEMHFVDGAPPVIDSISFLPSSPMYYDSVQVNFTAYDERTGISEAYIDYYNGTGWDRSYATDMGTYYLADIPALPYGTEVLVEVTAWDHAGLHSTDDNGGTLYRYTVDDDVDPTLSIDAPIDMAEVEGDTLFSATATDAGSGVDRVEVFRGVEWVATKFGAPWSFNITFDNWPLGMHTLTAIAYDEAGNTASDSINVTVIDTVPPLITSPSDVEFDEGESGNWVAWDADDLRGIDEYEVLVNGTAEYSGIFSGNSTVNVTLDYLEPGLYNFTCVIYDTSDNWVFDTVWVTVNEVVTTTTSTTTTTATTTGTTTETTSTTSSGTTTGTTTDALVNWALGLAAAGALAAGGLMVGIYVVRSKKNK